MIKKKLWRLYTENKGGRHEGGSQWSSCQNRLHETEDRYPFIADVCLPIGGVLLDDDFIGYRNPVALYFYLPSSVHDADLRRCAILIRAAGARAVVLHPGVVLVMGKPITCPVQEQPQSHGRHDPPHRLLLSVGR